MLFLFYFIFLSFLFSQTFPEDPERALHSLPPSLVVKESGMPGAGLGVWTVQDIPACTLFGPYEGEVVSGEQAKSSGSYAWQVNYSRYTAMQIKICIIRSQEYFLFPHLFGGTCSKELVHCSDYASEKLSGCSNTQ